MQKNCILLQDIDGQQKDGAPSINELFLCLPKNLLIIGSQIRKQMSLGTYLQGVRSENSYAQSGQALNQKIFWQAKK